MADRHPGEDRGIRAFVAEAQSLRGLMAHTLAVAEHVEASGRPAGKLGTDHSMTELSSRYALLMAEWMNEAPEGMAGCVAMLELAGDIIARRAAGLEPLSGLDQHVAVALVRLSKDRLAELAEGEA